jgi:hypothetical protein
MLEHFFWLLEFKFKFEFYCLKPFLKFPKPFSSPYPIPFSFQPTHPIQPAQQRQPSRPPHPPRPPSSPAARSSLRPSSPQLRLRPSSHASRISQQCSGPFGLPARQAAVAPLSPRPQRLTAGACVSSPSPVVPDPDTGAPPPRSPTLACLEAWPARLGARRGYL